MDNIIEVTESAQNHINKILLSEKSNYFRITVLGGGCAGSVSYTHLTLPTSDLV